MNVLELFKPITIFVFDIDGVLTNGNLILLPDGLMARSMNIKDGYAMQFAVKKNYHVVIITGANSPEAEERLKKLGVSEVFTKVKNKKECLEAYLKDHHKTVDEVLYMGDDLPDYEVMHAVAMPCAPTDAVGEIKSIAKYISPFKGGEGCVRDVIEKTLKIKGEWGIDTHIRSL